MEKLPAEGHENMEKLKPRHSTRVVLLDEAGKVAIINARKHRYYKIPGGGIEDGEEAEAAARREAKEESGCDCKLIGRLGEMETEIPVWGILDESEGFMAVVSGEKTHPEYEDWEKERGFEIEWFDSIDRAIEVIEKNVVKEPGMESLQARDLEFLKRAREWMTFLLEERR